ncbi:MAG: M23 family metallopeptidase [Bacteroidia bacterium]|nr:M23 family metallopeptidase [Bacteroidia bacterium]
MSTTRKKLIHKLKNKYRLVIMNDQTFEEKFSLKLTPMNLFIALSSGILTFTGLILSLFFFTPLKEYVPGYADPDSKRNVAYLILKADSLQNVVRQLNDYIENQNDIMRGKEPKSDRDAPPLSDSVSGSIDLQKIYENDSIFKLEMEKDNPYALEEKSVRPDNISSYTFMSPLKGLITEKFNFPDEHYAVDVVAKPSEAVKATLNGTIIFASWTPETGHVIGIQHPNDLISIYKHNSVLLKKVGTFVNAGDAIAIVGNSGELTTGAHLHFELWYKGNPVNPEEYMVF